MSGLDLDFVTHSLIINENVKPVQQNPRKMHPRIDLAIKNEIEKYFVADFIVPIDYYLQISNIVPTTKPNGEKDIVNISRISTRHVLNMPFLFLTLISL